MFFPLLFHKPSGILAVDSDSQGTLPRDVLSRKSIFNRVFLVLVHSGDYAQLTFFFPH